MTRDFQPDDLHRFREITGIHAVAQAASAACAVLSVDAAGDRYTSAIWRVPLDAGEPRQLSSGLGMDEKPRWSPDGTRLAFLSDRGGSPQIHLMPADGGEARALTSFARGVQAFEWSPDGTRLLAVCPIEVDPDARGERREGKPPERGPNAPEVAWRLPYKADGSGYRLGAETHLFVVDAESGDDTRITDGAFDVGSASWSPDGQQLVYSRSREGRTAHRTDLWIGRADESAGARQVTRDQAIASSPSWSPDGRWVAFLGALDAGDAQLQPWLLDPAKGTVTSLGGPDLEVASGEALRWSDDSRSLFAVLVENGLPIVAEIAVDDGSLQRRVGGERTIASLALVGDRLVFAAQSAADPHELYVARRDGSEEKRRTGFNDWWRERAAPRVEWRSFEVPDGRGASEHIDGWLVRPPKGKGAGPLLVDVHGGPASYVLLDYHSHPYWQVLASRGWSILALNAVGSASYGRDFAERLRGAWGELDLPQHLAAVRRLQEEGIADERLAIAGKSYGGFLSAYAIGKSTLFRTAVVIAPVGNLETHYGTSDSGYYADPYALLGRPAINRDTCRRLSPMHCVEQARTPTLFLQGKEDERCPKCQSEELFVTLMASGDTPAELVLYPNGSHKFLEKGKPSQRLDAVNRIVEWVERWIDRPLPAQPPADASAEQERAEPATADAKAS